jgi:hypothetical protein
MRDFRTRLTTQSYPVVVLASVLSALGCGSLPTSDQLRLPKDTGISVSFEMVFERFDESSGTIESLTPPSARRNLFSVVAFEQSVLVLGGLNNAGNYLRDVEIFDTATLGWHSGASWQNPRFAWHATAAGFVCELGGYRTSIAHAVRDVECYEPASDSWSVRTPLPEQLDSFDPVAFGGRIFVLGGARHTSDELFAPLATAYAYDPASDVWTALAPLPAPRAGATAHVIGERIYLVGGYGAQATASSEPQARDMFVYDPSSNSWTSAPQMPTDRFLFGADVAGGQLLTYLGLENGSLLDHFDPGQNVWAAGREPAMPLAPGVYTSVADGDGLYLLVLADRLSSGGTAASGKLWKYDVPSDAWSIVGQRAPDSRDALFLGVPIEQRLYFAGALTSISY